jgi:hypothetical protein
MNLISHFNFIKTLKHLKMVQIGKYANKNGMKQRKDSLDICIILEIKSSILNELMLFMMDIITPKFYKNISLL